MSRPVAWDYLTPRIRTGWRILDVGAGESPFTGWLLDDRKCTVTATDRDLTRLSDGWKRWNKRFEIVCGDMRDVHIPEGCYDCVIAAYSLQCMIGYEPSAWIRIHRWLKPKGVFLCLSRYQIDAPKYEGQRGDPLFGMNEQTINTLATLCLFELVDLQIYEYLGAEFKKVSEGTVRANAVGFQLRATTR